MVDRSILFSAPMIRALLAGRKTQTRRVLSRHTWTVLGERWGAKSPWEGLRFDEAVARERSPISGARDAQLAVPFCHPADEPCRSDECGIYRVRPMWEVGDRLWVREAWRVPAMNDHVSPRDMPLGLARQFEADGAEIVGAGREAVPCPIGAAGRLRAAIHMPRWVSRLTLHVTDVRVQRLQEISEADALAEGIDRIRFPERGEWGWPQERFKAVWNSINGPDGWAANPWVVALSFEVERANIDAARRPIERTAA